MAQVTLATSHGQGRSGVGRGGELINAFPQLAAEDAKAPAWLICAPGTALFKQLQTTGETVLAMEPAFTDRMVVVTDASIYSVQASGDYSVLGVGLPGPVSTAHNGQVAVVVNGVSGLVITQSAANVITDPDFLPADTVDFIAGYFVFTRSATNGAGQYFISGVYTTDFDALDFATAESAPDNLLAVVALRREIWLFGAETVEVHAVTTGTFPFQPLPGVSINHGCAAPLSAISVGQSVVWFSESGIIFQSIGYQALRISTHEIEEEIKALKADWANAYAWTYIEDGHEFYCLTVGETATFTFDFATRRWHKRTSVGTDGRHIAKACASAFGKVFVGDTKGRIHELSTDYKTDVDGDVVMIVGSLPYERKDKRHFNTPTLTIDCEVGQGAGATLEHSDDDGNSWSSRLSISLGALGEHNRVARWTRLGTSRRKRFRLRLYGDARKRMATTAELGAA